MEAQACFYSLSMLYSSVVNQCVPIVTYPSGAELVKAVLSKARRPEPLNMVASGIVL